MYCEITKDIEEKIIKDYQNSKSSCPDIAKKYGTYTNFVNRLLSKRGIKLRTNAELNRKYFFNEHYFDVIDCEEKAYFLGFLYADGFNNERIHQITMNLQEEDKHILDRFSKLIGLTKELIFIKKARKHWKNQYRLIINSKIMSDRLAKIGCFYKKSLTLKFPDDKIISEKLMRHFIRGYVDGDGYFALCTPKKHKNRRACHLNIVSTEHFCLALKEIIKKQFDINSWVYKIEESKPTARLCVSAISTVAKILDWLYENSKIYLKRKYSRYKEIKKWQNRKKKNKK